MSISLAGTLAAVQQYDRQQMAEGIPALKQCLSQAEQSMAETTTVQKTMQEWSDTMPLQSGELASFPGPHPTFRHLQWGSPRALNTPSQDGAPEGCTGLSRLTDSSHTGALPLFCTLSDKKLGVGLENEATGKLRLSCSCCQIQGVYWLVLARWEQPALSLTPWLNYDGMDMQQWVRQWRVLTTKLRQLSAI